jgi:probable F420-dependent oxidoreductase
MSLYKIGVQIQPQHTTIASYLSAVRHLESLGVDAIFNWDHFFPLSGDPAGLHYEAYTLLAASAALTTRAQLGCLVTCNSYRNPNLLADMARTIDHISNGRFILGLGSGWNLKDYTEYGYEYGTPGSRLADLEKNLPIIRARLEKLNPPPVRRPLPILIGGTGERKTLRMVAQYADLWNGIGQPDELRHKNEVIDHWCAEIGRDPATIERTALLIRPEDMDCLDAFVEAGCTHLLLALGEPWNYTPLEKALAWRDQSHP